MFPFNATVTRSTGLVLVLLCCLLAAAGCRKPEVQRTDIHGQRDLDRAVREGDLAQVEALIKEGAQVNMPDAEGVFPIHRAARNGNPDLVKLLLSYRADPTLTTRDGWSPVLLAAWYGHPSTVSLLLANGAKPNGTTPQGWNMVHMAAVKNMPTLLDTVLRSWESGEKPDVNARDKRGRTPLHLAIEHESIDVLPSLLMKGADATVPGPGGESPLHMAIHRGDIPLVSPLLSYGGASGTNTNRQKAVELAQELGKTNLANYLWQRLEQR